MVKRKIPKTIMASAKRLKQSLEADQVPVNTMYLFGSYAKGTAHRWSDIDLCIISTAFGRSVKDPLNYLWSKRAFLRDFNMEPIGFSPKDFKENTPLIAEIKKYGIKI